MFFTHRRFGTVALAAGSLILSAAVAAVITEPLPAGRSASIGKPVPRRVAPDAVATKPSAGGGTDSGLQLSIPGKTADSRSVSGPKAGLLGHSAGTVRVGGGPPQARLAGRSAGRGSVPGPQATLPGNTTGGGTALGSQAALLGNAADGGTVPGPQATLPGDTSAETTHPDSEAPSPGGGADGGAVPEPEATPTGSSADNHEDPGSEDQPRHRKHHGDSRRTDRDAQRERRDDGHPRQDAPPDSAEQGPTASPEPSTDADKEAPETVR
jgi:hypothetical protein